MFVYLNTQYAAIVNFLLPCFVYLNTQNAVMVCMSRKLFLQYENFRLEKDLSAKRKRGSAAPIPNKSIRLDSFAHWPSCMCDGKHGRCKLLGCNKVTRVICSKCKVNLCFTAKANCFKYFHTH